MLERVSNRTEQRIDTSRVQPDGQVRLSLQQWTAIVSTPAAHGEASRHHVARLSAGGAVTVAVLTGSPGITRMPDPFCLQVEGIADQPALKR